MIPVVVGFVKILTEDLFSTHTATLSLLYVAVKGLESKKILQYTTFKTKQMARKSLNLYIIKF